MEERRVGERALLGRELFPLGLRGAEDIGVLRLRAERAAAVGRLELDARAAEGNDGELLPDGETGTALQLDRLLECDLGRKEFRTTGEFGQREILGEDSGRDGAGESEEALAVLLMITRRGGGPY